MTKPKPNKTSQVLPLYQPGKSSTSFTDKPLIKLSSNENPFGMAISVNDLQTLTDLSRYPNSTNNPLILELIQKHAVTSDNLILGNGSDELFQLVAMSFLDSGDEVISSEHTFSIYQIATLARGATYIEVPMKNYTYDLKGILTAITPKTRVIFIANPNNPTGTFLTANDIANFMNKVPSHVLVVLDEAYKDYVITEELDHNVSLLASHKNILITRTFSKMYGMAGFRLGYGLSSPAIIAALLRVKMPFNINQYALHAGCLALQNTSFYDSCKTANLTGMTRILDTFKDSDVVCLPSHGNFICIMFEQLSGKEVFQFFINNGIIVRDLSSFGIPNGIRVTIGKPEQVSDFIDNLKTLLKEKIS
ncbi:histidinol-phosphate transaminase [Candidatus Marinamargulisbacteria bacterium SCGC AG-414-C22]|nr:histidinol-phosphate transaminase [Candidatus Marinamargulisbacteria bacterium SCGC AG-414-C22]